MVARIASQSRQPPSGPRPLNLMRDLGAVADLMEVAFKEELDSGGRRLIREARAMSRTGPLLLLLSRLSGASVGLHPGFVWEEDGRIVGNVTVVGAHRPAGAWQIANVAVHPDFRGQGIATRLLQTVIDHVRRFDGRSIRLQVRKSSPAIALYQRLGFHSLGAFTRWRTGRELHRDRILTGGRPLRRAVQNDWAAIWELFSSVTPAAQGWPEPRRQNEFRPSFWRAASDLMTGRSVQRWVAPGSDALDGYVELQTQPGLSPRLTLRLRADGSDRLAGDLLLVALRQLWSRGGRRAWIEHPDGDGPVEGRLREVEFEPLRTLALMQLRVDRPTCK